MTLIVGKQAGRIEYRLSDLVSVTDSRTWRVDHTAQWLSTPRVVAGHSFVQRWRQAWKERDAVSDQISQGTDGFNKLIAKSSLPTAEEL